MFHQVISVKAMFKPVIVVFVAALSVAGCANHGIQAATYSPPAVALTVASRDHVEDADRQASRFCHKYDKRAERETAITEGERVTLTYECR